MNVLPHNRHRRNGVRGRWLELVAVGGVIALVISAIVLVTRSGSTPSQPPTRQAAAVVSTATTAPTSTPVASPTETAEAVNWSATQTALATDYADQPAPKATSYAVDVEAGATALASSPGPEVGPPSPQPDQPLQAGLEQDGQAPFSPMVFVVKDSWKGPVESPTQWLLVFAGATRDVHAEGGAAGPAALRVYRITTTSAGVLDTFVLIGNLLSPTTSGPLTITAVNGTVLDLQTEGGESLTFDLLTQQFQPSSDPTPVPTEVAATPTP